jgi:Replication-relaxation
VNFMNNYVTQATAERLVDQLSERDRAILLDLARVRVLTGDQLGRLHFDELSTGSRDRTRRRVLARLIDLQLAATLERTIGGSRAGSSGLIYSLAIAGQKALPLLSAETSGHAQRPRTPWTPSTFFLSHSLAISGLYVALREEERAQMLTLRQFTTEPAAWYPNGSSGFVKPDAYAVVLQGGLEGGVQDSWWIEVDRATESIPTLKRKLMTYIEFARSGQRGPDCVVPRVLLTVPHDHRLAAVRDLIEALPEPARQLILPTLHGRAVPAMIDILRG